MPEFFSVEKYGKVNESAVSRRKGLFKILCIPQLVTEEKVFPHCCKSGSCKNSEVRFLPVFSKSFEEMQRRIIRRMMCCESAVGN